MVAVPAAMKAAGKPRAVGLLVAKELEIIDGLMATPKRPLLGDHGRGQGVGQDRRSSRPCSRKVDHLLIGGKMTYTFLKAQRRGRRQRRRSPTRSWPPPSRCSPHVGTKIALPVDSLAREVGRPERRRRCVEGADPGRATRAWTSARRRSPLYADEIKKAGDGDLERPGRLVRAAGVQQGHEGRSPRRWPTSAAVTVVGGGETAEAVEQFGFDDEDDARLDRRRGVPRLRRGQEVPASLAQIDDK